IQNIYAAFLELGERVNTTLRTQLGDAACLNEQKQMCLQFLAQINQHLPAIPLVNQEVILLSVTQMIKSLDNAITTSSDIPDGPPIILGVWESPSGSGRPMVDIDPKDLAMLVSGHQVTHERLANLYNCHPQTICHHLFEYRLSAPGPPVYTTQTEADGTATQNYQPGSSSELSTLPDDQLNALVLSIYHQFPSFGRRMIDGYL
ncbi:hypothetical protein PAXRUDRAFT_92506, partial [Paxillus rubicundulus Ve08.2h10]